MIVVDASAMLELLLLTPAGNKVATRVFEPKTTLHAPELIDVEVAQVLRRYERSGDLNASRGIEALQDLKDLPIERYSHQGLLPRIWELRDNLTAYDAAYVALAEILDTPLLTSDARLARAPHGARVELIPD